jgi:hypothetical protein
MDQIANPNTAQSQFPGARSFDVNIFESDMNAEGWAVDTQTTVEFAYTGAIELAGFTESADAVTVGFENTLNDPDGHSVRIHFASYGNVNIETPILTKDRDNRLPERHTSTNTILRMDTLFKPL